MKLRKSFDFLAEDRGDIVILFPETHFGRMWVKANLYLEPWHGDNEIPIDKKLFLEQIRYDMEDEGMSVQWSQHLAAA